MFVPLRRLVALFVLISAFAVAEARAENEGQSDLDLAIATKLKADTYNDLSNVIRLCESGLKKGLDEDNTEFAKQLLSSARVQRGSRIAKEVLTTLPPSPNWRQFRQVALDDLEKGIEGDAEQPSALFLIAQLNMLPGGDAKRASEALDKAIELSQDLPRQLARYLLIRSSLKKKPEEKLVDLDAAIAADSTNVNVVRERGGVHAEMKSFDKALVDLKTAVKLQRDSARTHLDAADLNASRALQRDSARTHLALASVLIEMKKYDESLAQLDTVQALLPTSVAPLVQKARIYALQSDYDTALKILDEAHALDAGNIAVLLIRASVYQELEKNEKAMADVDRVLQLSPGDQMAMRFRVMLLAGSGKLDVAIDQLEELQQATPGDVEVVLQLAMFYAAENRPHEAIRHYSAALEKDPGNTIAIRGRGDSYLSVGNHAGAIGDLTKALEANPDDSAILNNLAWVLATSPDDALRDGEKAKKLATKACELTKYEAPHILSTLAASHAETGDFKTALKWSAKAVELGSDEQQEPLQKELKTYQEGKPVRERMTVPEPKKEDKPQADKPQADKPQADKPQADKPQAPKLEPPKLEPPKLEPPKLEPPAVEKPAEAKSDKPTADKPKSDKPKSDKPKADPPKELGGGGAELPPLPQKDADAPK